jgi:hypothetical protein
MQLEPGAAGLEKLPLGSSHQALIGLPCSIGRHSSENYLMLAEKLAPQELKAA